MMADYITFCLFSSFIITGFYLSAYDGGLLSFLRTPFEDAESVLIHNGGFDSQLGKSRTNFLKSIVWIGKPLIMCAKCMASIWGTLLYLYWFDSFVFVEWACVVLCVSFFNVFWSLLYFKL